MGFIASTVSRNAAERGSNLSTPLSTGSPSRRSLRRWSALLGAVLLLSFPQGAWAQTALTWARVELLRNRVQLIPNGRGARTAQLADVLGVGDALRTARAARAELRFNDGSLARIGERATFRFTPNTRNFQLSNGTVLLLLPPGRGRTTIQTPNAVTGIQGSALFVRFIEETDTTIIGALTNNAVGPMVAYNASGSQEQPLYAGQMVVIEGDQITRLFDFDIAEFYRTSGLMEGLDAESVEGVYEEMREALEEQQEFNDEGLQENPSFIAPPAIADAPSYPSGLGESSRFAAVPAFEGSAADRFHQIFSAQRRPTSRYPQATAEANPPVTSVNTTGQANQVTANRQRDEGGIVASTPVPGTSNRIDPVTSPTAGGSPGPAPAGDGLTSNPVPSNPVTPNPVIPNPVTPEPVTPTVPNGGSTSPTIDAPVVNEGPTTPTTPTVPVITTPEPVAPDTVPDTVPDTTVPDSTNPTVGGGQQPPTRPDGGSLDWIPDANATNAIPPNSDASLVEIVEGPAAVEPNDLGQPELLTNPNTPPDNTPATPTPQ